MQYFIKNCLRVTKHIFVPSYTLFPPHTLLKTWFMSIERLSEAETISLNILLNTGDILVRKTDGYFPGRKVLPKIIIIKGIKSREKLRVISAAIDLWNRWSFFIYYLLSRFHFKYR